MTKRDNVKRQFSGQHQDEEILVVVHQFPIVLRGPLLLGAIILVVSTLPWLLALSHGYSWVVWAARWLWLGLIILFFYWLRAWVSYYYSVYMLTTQRVIIHKQRGFFNRSVSELALNNIQNVNYQVKGFTAALFKFGNIMIGTLSGSGGLKLSCVHNPALLQQRIIDACHRVGSTPNAK